MKGITMADMQYDTDGLRTGARIDRESADGAAATASRLRGGTIAGSAFGDVGNASAFASQAGRTAQERADGATAAAEHRDDQGRRADSAAGQGDGLTADSTTIANAAPKGRAY
jgi:hypothetical protein